jgi:DNA-binding transcriptional LysR family regulator
VTLSVGDISAAQLDMRGNPGIGATGDEETIDVVVHAGMGCDDFGYLRAAVLAGGGAALMPRLVCAKDEAAGRLVRVLPGFEAKGAGLYVLHPSAAHVPARVTAFRDFVAAAFVSQANRFR